MVKTIVKSIPSNWNIKNCEACCSLTTVGIVVRPSSYYVQNGVPALRNTNIKENWLDLRDLVFISEDDNNNKAIKSKLKKGDVLITRSGTPGVSCTLPEELDGINCIDILILRPINSIVNSEYLSYYFNSTLGKKQVYSMKTGMAQQHLNVREVKKVKILLPTIKEQNKIKSILSNFDQLIFHTKKIIKNLHFLRKALMQRLFISGIGHTEFKETKLGKIPKEWEISKLENVAEIKAGGNAPQGNKYFSSGKYPFVRVQHFNGEKLYVDKWDLINDKAVEDYNLELFPENAIIFPKSGATINLEKRALIPKESYIVGHLCVVLYYVKTIDLYYLFYYLKHLRLARFSAGSTLPYLNLKYISKIKIPLPSRLEQKKIGKFLFDIDKIIENEQNYLNNLKNTKKGLMQDLLTGKKRVKFN